MRAPNWPFLAAAAALTACAEQPVTAQQQSPLTSPPLAFQGVSQIGVLCSVATGGQPDDGRLQARLCERVRALASRGAPHAVSVIAPGDPALLEPGRLTILVHAAVERDMPGARLVLALRPYRSGGPEADIIFGAAPRSAPLGEERRIGDALEASLDEILPWLRAASGP